MPPDFYARVTVVGHKSKRLSHEFMRGDLSRGDTVKGCDHLLSELALLIQQISEEIASQTGGDWTPADECLASLQLLQREVKALADEVNRAIAESN